MNEDILSDEEVDELTQMAEGCWISFGDKIDRFHCSICGLKICGKELIEHGRRHLKLGSFQ